ncbi:MAG TPA: SCO family protein [Solirubrobacterales bacterium]|jgi:protein SCO1/2|nr:SCO family protein [Solirubrobacterales bacterium]
MSIRDDRRLRALTAIAVISLLALLVLAAVFIVTGNSTKADAPGYVDATVYPGGAVAAPTMRLEDAASGKTFDTASLRGRPYMVTFLYTHCPDICPLIGAELQGALHELGAQAKKVDVVALSVDPRGDTRSAVQAWLKVHQEPANFHYLIGSEAELQPYWEAWHVGPQIAGDPDSSHTAAIYLITRVANIAGIVDAGTQVPSSDLAQDFRTLIGT